MAFVSRVYGLLFVSGESEDEDVPPPPPPPPSATSHLNVQPQPVLMGLKAQLSRHLPSASSSSRSIPHSGTNGDIYPSPARAPPLLPKPNNSTASAAAAPSSDTEALARAAAGAAAQQILAALQQSVQQTVQVAPAPSSYHTPPLQPATGELMLPPPKHIMATGI